MNEKRYMVLDEFNNVIATDMNLDIALLLIKAYSDEFYRETTVLILKEVERDKGDSI